MVEFFNFLFGSLLSLLPDSFFAKFIELHGSDFANFYEIMSYVNYFFPFYLLIDIFDFWIMGMTAAVSGLVIYWIGISKLMH